MASSETTVVDPAPTRRISQRRWLAWGISLAILGLLLAYDTWEGIGNFIGVATQSASIGLKLSSFGIFVIYASVLAPSALFVLAVVTTLATRLRAFWIYLVMALILSALISADLVLGTSAYLMFTVS
jgi:hypothetical protein